VCALFLPQYFRYSIEAKQVESTGTESDRSFTGRFTRVLSVFFVLKNQKKRKQRMKREEYGVSKEGEHRRMYVCFMVYI